MQCTHVQFVHTHTSQPQHSHKSSLASYTIPDVVEACAMALNQMGMLSSNHVARWVNCSETFLPRGSSSVTKPVLFTFVTNEGPRGQSMSLQFTPLACYVITQQRPHLVRPTLTNTVEQRGRGGLTNITISSQVACDHRKVFRAELVSTPPDGLDTVTRSSKVRKR